MTTLQNFGYAMRSWAAIWRSSMAIVAVFCLGARFFDDKFGRILSLVTLYPSRLERVPSSILRPVGHGPGYNSCRGFTCTPELTTSLDDVGSTVGRCPMRTNTYEVHSETTHGPFWLPRCGGQSITKQGLRDGERRRSSAALIVVSVRSSW